MLPKGRACPSIRPSLRPSTFSCLESKTIQAIDLKFYRWIVEKCSVQETKLLSYYPLLFICVFSFPEHKSNAIQATDFKLHRWIDLIVEKCSAQKTLLSA